MYLYYNVTLQNYKYGPWEWYKPLEPPLKYILVSSGNSFFFYFKFEFNTKVIQSSPVLTVTLTCNQNYNIMVSYNWYYSKALCVCVTQDKMTFESKCYGQEKVQ